MNNSSPFLNHYFLNSVYLLLLTFHTIFLYLFVLTAFQNFHALFFLLVVCTVQYVLNVHVLYVL
jgi:hypothetical protein